MLHTDMIVVCSENHIKYINTICGHYLEFLNVKRGGTYGITGPQRSGNKSNLYDNNNTQGRFAQHERQT
jgi:hypothetical protein